VPIRQYLLHVLPGSADRSIQSLAELTPAVTSVNCVRVPRVLGIDDWAWRKGRRYGTILCDLENGEVADLVPERSEESTEQWLRTHPGAEIMSRDRASLESKASAKAAPRAMQIADRWHLLHNMSDALVDALARRMPQLHQLWRELHSLGLEGRPTLAYQWQLAGQGRGMRMRCTPGWSVAEARSTARAVAFGSWLEVVGEIPGQQVAPARPLPQAGKGLRTTLPNPLWTSLADLRHP
jgi:hypothetical protein